VELPYAAIRANIVDAVQLVLQIERRNGKRRAEELLRIERYDTTQDRIRITSIYRAA